MNPGAPVPAHGPEWFDAPAPGRPEPGLRFACTQCGNCCTGPSGYVLFTPEEASALARRLGVSDEVFWRDYTHDTPAGRSLGERATPHGMDCVFLDRLRSPGRAVCAVYEDRPAQCRTWPFWKSNLGSPDAWARARRVCPGMDRGELVPPERVRVLRDRVDM